MRAVRVLILHVVTVLLATVLAPPDFPGALSQASAATIAECGQYKFFGKVAFENGRFWLVVFADSLSETRLRLDPETASTDSMEAFRSLQGYLGRRMLVRGKIQRLPVSYRGNVVLESAIPVLPMGPGAHSSDEFQLLEQMPCASAGATSEESRGQ